MEAVLVILVGLYFVPLGVAAVRNHNPVGVAIVNVLLGWTVIGWCVALVMACGSVTKPVTMQVGVAPPASRFDTATGQPIIGYDTQTGRPVLGERSEGA